MDNDKRVIKIANSWATCTSCDLSHGRMRVVSHRGSALARMMVIGEAPGEQEDLRGLPFVGPAGKMLNEMLAEAGLDPKRDVFVANMVGCRPPANRVPKREELKACRPRIFGLIEAVDPEVLLLCGATAAKLAAVTSVGPWRGHPLEVESADWTYPAVVTYHPSFLLRQGNSPNVRSKIVSDIKTALALGQKT